MKRGTVYGSVFVQNFKDKREAEEAVLSLIEAGFTNDEISIVIPESTSAQSAKAIARSFTDVMDDGRTTEVSRVGLVIGGPLMPVLGKWDQKASATGRLSRALRELGVEREEARHYRDRSEAGDIVVVAVVQQR